MSFFTNSAVLSHGSLADRLLKVGAFILYFSHYYLTLTKHILIYIALHIELQMYSSEVHFLSLATLQKHSSTVCEMLLHMVTFCIHVKNLTLK